MDQHGQRYINMKKLEIQELVSKLLVEQLGENIGNRLTDATATGLLNVVMEKLSKAIPDDPKE